MTFHAHDAQVRPRYIISNGQSKDVSVPNAGNVNVFFLDCKKYQNTCTNMLTVDNFCK